jgi:hypothetical protein
MIALAGGVGRVHPAQGAPFVQADEYRVKAEYLLRFLSYVQWPEDHGERGGTDLVIGYRGDSSLRSALQLLEGRQVGTRRVTLRALRGVEDIAGCRLIFAGDIGRREMERFVDAAREHHVLTVGDRQGFTRAGGIIGFVIRGSNIRFEINHRAARQAGLTISAQLLKLATSVIE